MCTHTIDMEADTRARGHMPLPWPLPLPQRLGCGQELLAVLRRHRRKMGNCLLPELRYVHGDRGMDGAETEADFALRTSVVTTWDSYGASGI